MDFFNAESEDELTVLAQKDQVFKKPVAEVLRLSSDKDVRDMYGVRISLSLRRDYVEGTGSSPVGYVEGIYVKPAHRKKGIARALVAFAGAWARAEGCVEMASDCALTNEDSRLFHGKVGFTEANRIVCFTMDISGT